MFSNFFIINCDKYVILTSILLIAITTQSITYGQTIRKFPTGFKWGVGSSSYQIEGGWNEDGKGESIWDYMTHNFPDKIKNRDNGDVSADSYHNWRRDIEMVQELGLDIYRFSLSWPRIMPNGYLNTFNEKGIKYYNVLIDELLKKNITPMVTLYHWDLPQHLQEIGGWTNPEVIRNFKDFAKLAFQIFGDRVKLWTTINEPWQICEMAYGLGIMAPGVINPGIPIYLCGHNVLKAHAEVVHLYRDEFQTDQKGKIGITIHSSWAEPLTESKDDTDAAETTLQFYLGWFAHPIFSKDGNYPKVMIDRIAEMSKKQGFLQSRLPQFTPEEIERVKGTSDYFGINHYTSIQVKKNDPQNSANYSIPSFDHDMGIIDSVDPSWAATATGWLYVVPHGMRSLLNWIKKEYDNPSVLITENGVSDRGGLKDKQRVDYINSYLESVLDAIDDGCDVQGYIAWCLMDNFEWASGYSERFGLYSVDFSTSDKKRTPKTSARVYANIVKNGYVDLEYTGGRACAIYQFNILVFVAYICVLIFH